MPSSPRHPAPTPKNLSGTETEDLALYREKFRRRLPQSLDELHGPSQGIVRLPLHMAWSGMTSYDLSKPRQCMGLYRTVLHEGLHDDLPQYLDRDLFLQREDLRANLTGAEWTDDEAFAAYGLEPATMTSLRTWALEWADDLATRLLEESDDPDID